MLSIFLKRSKLLTQLNDVKPISLFCSIANQNQQKDLTRPDKLYKKLQLEIRSNDTAVINSYIEFARLAAENLGITYDGVTLLGKRKAGKNWLYKVERQICLRSAFVHKKHREQYEWRTNTRFMNFSKITESTIDTFLEYVERNLPEGCSLIVHKYEAIPMFEHLLPPNEEIKNQENRSLK